MILFLTFPVKIAQHRRLYLAHFDVDGKVDVITGDAEKRDSGKLTFIPRFISFSLFVVSLFCCISRRNFIEKWL